MSSSDTPGSSFRKKPVVITATQWHAAGDHPAVERPWSKKSDYRCEKCGGAWGAHGVIRTLESTQDGGHFVCPGDWIITGVKGENYACKPDIFAATYEPASTSSERAQPYSDMHRCLGFAFEMRPGGVRTWPVWCCSMDTVKEAEQRGWLKGRKEPLIPREGLSQIVYSITNEGEAEFCRIVYRRSEYVAGSGK